MLSGLARGVRVPSGAGNHVGCCVLMSADQLGFMPDALTDSRYAANHAASDRASVAAAAAAAGAVTIDGAAVAAAAAAVATAATISLHTRAAYAPRPCVWLRQLRAAAWVVRSARKALANMPACSRATQPGLASVRRLSHIYWRAACTTHEACPSHRRRRADRKHRAWNGAGVVRHALVPRRRARQHEQRAAALDAARRGGVLAVPVLPPGTVCSGTAGRATGVRWSAAVPESTAVPSNRQCGTVPGRGGVRRARGACRCVYK